MSDFSIDENQPSSEALERLINITKMFSGKINENDEYQQLQKVEKIIPSEKIKNTFQKFEEFESSNGQNDCHDDYDNDDDIHLTLKRKKTPKEHVPYHEMAEVKDKFEKGLIDSNKPRIEKRLDVRVQSGITSSKKHAFEQGEFEQNSESQINKTQIDADLVSGLTSAKKYAFEQQQQQQQLNTSNKTNVIEHDVLTGLTAENRAKFENGQLLERSKLVTCSNELANIVGTGLAQTLRSEFLSKIDAEQQTPRSSDRQIDFDTEHGLATARRERLASLANCEYKPTEKYIDVAVGLTNTIKEQYIADASKPISKSTVTTVDIENGLTKNRATVFEKFDETIVKRTVDIENELVERGVAKERVAMFKNLETGTQTSIGNNSGDSKLRVDENGHIIRESDKLEEIYFEKGQTKQLVERWKIKQNSLERDTSDLSQTLHDSELVQQGQAKNLVQMWKTIDKENTSPPERRGIRAFTPPVDNQRRILSSEDDETNLLKSNDVDDKETIELGHARAAREKFLQTAEQNNSITKRKTLKQITPPPESIHDNRRKSLTPPNDGLILNIDEILPTKGQAKSLKNRFIELEQDSLKVETASSKLKYVPKRFVNTPAPKQNLNNESKCSVCDKTVYAMEKIVVDKKIYHKLCFK